LFTQDGVGHGKTIPRTAAGVLKVAKAVEKLFSDSQFFGKLESLTRQLFDVDVFEGKHSNRLDETISAVDVPHPNVTHV
jgi:hypothetical protein